MVWDKEDNMATINSDAILEGFTIAKMQRQPVGGMVII